MPVPIFSTNVNYYKNGIFWWQKVLNRIIGEKAYNLIRMEKRIATAKVYYARQQFLYQLNVTYPDIACALGTFSKFDASAGFPNPIPFETFRDFQENTPNSEGWFAMMVTIVCGAFTFYTIYCYLLPYYTANNYYQNGLEKRHRIKDYYVTSVYEELIGNSSSELVWSPHYFQHTRERLMIGYSNPDDIRRVFMTSFNRPHKYKEHYFNDRDYASNDMMKSGYQFNYYHIQIQKFLSISYQQFFTQFLNIHKLILFYVVLFQGVNFVKQSIEGQLFEVFYFLKSRRGDFPLKKSYL